MKKISSFLLLLALSFYFGTNVIALDADVDRSNGTIYISGNTAPLVRVTLLVLKEGYTAEDMEGISPKDFMNAVDYMDETISNEAGNFSFAYFAQETDKYARFIAIVNESGRMGAITELEFSYFTDSSVTSIANEIIDCTSAEELQALLTDEAIDILEAETVFYTKLSDTQLDTVYETLAALTEGDVEVLRNTFFEATLLAYANSITSKEEIFSLFTQLDAIDKMEEVCGFSLALQLYADLENNKGEVADRILKHLPLSSVGQLHTVSLEAFVLTAIKSYRYTYTKDILTDYNAVLGLDMSRLTASNETEVLKGLAGKDFSDIDSVQKAFAQLTSSGGSSDKTSSNESYSNRGSSSGGNRPGGSFGAPTGGVTEIVTSPASPTPKPSDEPAAYCDLAEDHFAYEAILALAEKNILAGYPDGSFQPEKTVTRAEFIKMLIAAFPMEAIDNVSESFTDLKQTDWYYSYVTVALSNGIVYGISDSEIGAELPVSREDVCVMLDRTLQKLEVAVPNQIEIQFDDAEQISDYAKKSVKTFAEAGIVSGTGTRFEPKNSATRAECAKIIYQVLEVAQ